MPNLSQDNLRAQLRDGGRDCIVEVEFSRGHVLTGLGAATLHRIRICSAMMLSVGTRSENRAYQLGIGTENERTATHTP